MQRKRSVQLVPCGVDIAKGEIHSSDVQGSVIDLATELIECGALHT